jgi:hypothetical protein
MGWVCRMHGEMIHTFRIVAEKPQSNRAYGRPRLTHTYVDNIKVTLKQMECACIYIFCSSLKDDHVKLHLLLNEKFVTSYFLRKILHLANYYFLCHV